MTGFNLEAAPLSGRVPAEDWAALHRLLILAADGTPVEALLAQLADQLGARTLQLCRPSDPPPDLQRAVVVPLHCAGQHLGDLYLDALPGMSTASMAERLAFFAPLVSLRTALNKI